MLWEYKPKASASILIEKRGNVLSFAKKHSFSCNYQNKFSSEFFECAECFSTFYYIVTNNNRWIIILIFPFCTGFISACFILFDPVSHKNNQIQTSSCVTYTFNKTTACKLQIKLVFPEIFTCQTLIFALIKDPINSKCYPFPTCTQHTDTGMIIRDYGSWKRLHIPSAKLYQEPIISLWCKSSTYYTNLSSPK